MTEMYFSLLAINKDLCQHRVCVELLPFFCQSYTSNTLPVSTFCAWCEICKCAPFAETVPDWQWDTFVVSRWGWHISPLLSIFLTLCHCLLQDVKLVLGGRSSSWSVSQLVKPAVWSESERNNILVSSPPARDSANALWSLMSSRWEQTSMTSLRLGIKFPWHARRSLWRFFFKNTRSGLFLSWLILLAPNNFQITHTETQWVITVNNALSE